MTRALLLTVLLFVPFSAEAAVKTKARAAARQTARVDYNCKDFVTQAIAQKFFLDNGGPAQDPYRLDADHDGVACEKNA